MEPNSLIKQCITVIKSNDQKIEIAFWIRSKPVLFVYSICLWQIYLNQHSLPTCKLTNNVQQNIKIKKNTFYESHAQTSLYVLYNLFNPDTTVINQWSAEFQKLGDVVFLSPNAVKISHRDKA